MRHLFPDPIDHLLQFDPTLELGLLLESFSTGDVRRSPSGLAAHFSLFRGSGLLNISDTTDHLPVLAVSIGGTTSKAMLVAPRQGRFCVMGIRVMHNPAEPTPFAAFFDELLFGDPAIRDYLRNTPAQGQQEQPRIGVSIAVEIIDGVPFHATKIPTITGLVARDRDRDMPTHHFGKNFSQYLVSRGVPRAQISYQGDGILAHLGAVAASRLPHETHSVLLVCGTGLATGDERNFVLCGMAPILTDPRLSDSLGSQVATEGGQYQYLIAGKGLYRMMQHFLTALSDHRTIPGSLTASFSQPWHSRTVIDLMEYHHTGLASPAVSELISSLPEALSSLVVEGAARIVDHGAAALANCILATAASMNSPLTEPPSLPTTLFLEGGIALRPSIRDLTLNHMRDRLAEGETFHRYGFTPPTTLHLHTGLVSPIPGHAGVSETDIQYVDLTLQGAAAMAIAAELLASPLPEPIG